MTTDRTSRDGNGGSGLRRALRAGGPELDAASAVASLDSAIDAGRRRIARRQAVARATFVAAIVVAGVGGTLGAIRAAGDGGSTAELASDAGRAEEGPAASATGGDLGDGSEAPAEPATTTTAPPLAERESTPDAAFEDEAPAPPDRQASEGAQPQPTSSGPGPSPSQPGDFVELDRSSVTAGETIRVRARCTGTVTANILLVRGDGTTVHGQSEPWPTPGDGTVDASFQVQDWVEPGSYSIVVDRTNQCSASAPITVTAA